VIAQPEVCTVDLARGDEFLVIGSDGLFELLDNQEIVDIVHACPGIEEACATVRMLYFFPGKE
jgi:serine/threonine protein phosphatase PrpC